MQIGRIQGATRVLGQSQGYTGLPHRSGRTDPFHAFGQSAPALPHVGRRQARRMITFAPIEAWGIRFHGRMWLVFTKFAPMGAEAYGWRRFTWTKDIQMAEKWGREVWARDFAERRLIGPFEIVRMRCEAGVVDHPA